MSYYTKQEIAENQKMLDAIIGLWNSYCTFATIKRLSQQDKEQIITAIRTRGYTKEEIETVITTVARAPKLNGKLLESGKSGYKASIGWVFRDTNFCDILNGAYYVEVEPTEHLTSLRTKISAYRLANSKGLKYPTVAEYLFTDAEAEHLEQIGKYKDGYILPKETDRPLIDNLQSILNPQKESIAPQELLDRIKLKS